MPRALISGIGISRVGRRTGIPGPDLTIESCRLAVADAGLSLEQIDGLASVGETPIGLVAASLGIEPEFRGGGVDNGGVLTAVMSAAAAVSEGRARHVLVYRTVSMMGGHSEPRHHASADGQDDPPLLSPQFVDTDELIAAHAYSAVNWLGLTCRRHMQMYGTTKEQLGWLAINTRHNAALNPLAVYRTPLTMDDYLSARTISDPFGLYDCDVPVDGSIAVVVSAADHVADCPHPPIWIASYGGASGADGWFHRPDYPKMAIDDAAAEMWQRTELRPSDIDVAQIYDGFTFITLAWLEALGICGRGESGPFVEGGTRIAIDGPLPLNTYGGQLSAGRVHGYWVLHEACLQLRGQAGERQVPRGPEVAVVAAGGGPYAGCLLLTR